MFKNYSSLILILLCFFVMAIAKQGESWKASLEGTPSTRPVIGYEKVFIGTNEGNILCFELSTGKLLWTFSTNGSIKDPLYYVDNMVVFVSADNKIYGITQARGQMIWEINADFNADILEKKVLPYDAINEVFCWGDSSGRIRICDMRSGKLKNINERIENDSYFETVAIGSDNYFDNIVAFNSPGFDGLVSYNQLSIYRPRFPQRWDSSLDVSEMYQRPLLHEGRIYWVEVEYPMENTPISYIRCMDELLDEEVWMHEFVEEFITSVPIVKGGILYLESILINSNDETQLFAMDIANGDMLWTLKKRQTKLVEPIIKGDVVIMADESGTLSFIDRYKGDVIYSVQLNVNISYAPAIFEKQIIVAGDDGYLYAAPLDPKGKMEKHGISWLDGNSKLQKLINKAEPGDVIELKAGEYEGTILLRNKNNIELKGSDGGETILFTYDPEATVLVIENCTNITISELTLTHKIDMSCVAGVISIDSSSEIKISDCDINGSGAYGIIAYDSRDIDIINNEIHGCSYWGIEIDAEDVEITGNLFYENGSYSENNVYVYEENYGGIYIYGNEYIGEDGDSYYDEEEYYEQEYYDEYEFDFYESYYFDDYMEYSVDDFYYGKVETLDYSESPWAFDMSDNFEEAYTDGMNFAGHFIIIEWECGDDCYTVSVVNAKTGMVYDGITVKGRYDYYPDSRLLIVNPHDDYYIEDDAPELEIKMYVWEEAEFVELIEEDE